MRKTVHRIGEHFGWSLEDIERLFEQKVDPTMLWNRLCGNAYTASLWISVANALRGLVEGQRLAAFSYGSGFGAELLVLHAGPKAILGEWARDVEDDLGDREQLDGVAYELLRS